MHIEINQSLIIDLFYFVFSQTFESASFLYIEINQSLIIQFYFVFNIQMFIIIIIIRNKKIPNRPLRPGSYGTKVKEWDKVTIHPKQAQDLVRLNYYNMQSD